MDGSEAGDVTAAAVLSGAPIDLQARTVRFVNPNDVVLQAYSSSTAVSFALPNQQHNQGLGMVTIGGWIGIRYKRAIGGRIH